MSFNKITIVGYLGQDPTLRYTPQGNTVCNFSVATTEKRKNSRGDVEEHTIWFRVTAWGRQAEVAHEYLAKGRQVYVEGRLRLEHYTDREGNPRISPEVNASAVHFLGQRVDATEQPEDGAEDDGQEIEKEAASKPATSRNGKRSNSKRAPAKEAAEIVVDDEVPF